MIRPCKRNEAFVSLRLESASLIADHRLADQNRQTNGTRKTDTTKNQISRGSPSFQ